MQPTLTTAYWLQRAADAWAQAEALDDPKVRAVRLLIAEGCQRMADHAALLANLQTQERLISKRPWWYYIVAWRWSRPRAAQEPSYAGE
jgi:hypothetical protein